MVKSTASERRGKSVGEDTGVPADDVVATAIQWSDLIGQSAWNQLVTLVADDFECRHANGRVESRAAWLDNLRRHPRTIEMSSPVVRLFDGVAALRCHHRQEIRQADGTAVIAELEVAQVWIKTEQHWQLGAHWHWMAWPGTIPIDTYYRFGPIEKPDDT